MNPKYHYLPPDTKQQIRKEFFNATPSNHHFYGKIMVTDRDLYQNFIDLVFHELQKIYGNNTIPQILYSEAEKVIPPSEDPKDQTSRKIFRPDLTSFTDMEYLVLNTITA